MTMSRLIDDEGHYINDLPEEEVEYTFSFYVPGWDGNITVTKKAYVSDEPQQQLRIWQAAREEAFEEAKQCLRIVEED